MSLVTSIVSVYCGLYFVASEDYDYVKDDPALYSKAIYLSNSTQLFFFAIIVISNIVFFSYWLAQMYQEIKNKVRKIVPNLYMWTCLCGDRNRLIFEIESRKLWEESELLKEEFLKRLTALKKLYYKGSMLLSQKNIEKLGVYLSKSNVLKAAGMKEEINLEKEELRQKRMNR